MRGQVDGSISPFPLGDTLPAVYLEDWYTQQMCDAFDEVLAPIFATLDSLTAYLDPRTSPDDLLNWLASWIGITFDGHESATRKRELITTGVDLLPWRGTVRSIREAVQAVFDTEPAIEESGGVAVSAEPGSTPPGTAQQSLTVRVAVPDTNAFDARRLDDVVTAVKPAHVPHRVEVVQESGNRVK